VPTCQGKAATIVGTNKADLILGTSQRDVIVARAGKDTIKGLGSNDVICGGPGNDVIKGGAGLDVLIGNAGRDACFPGADGGKLVSCEGADLRVNVNSPPSADSGESFDFFVHVKNVGARTASAVRLTIDFETTNVICGIDHSGVFDLGPLKPGAFVENTYFQDCVWESDPASVSLAVQAETSVVDDDPSNDADASSTTILAP
jgi:hypothetical protein